MEDNNQINEEAIKNFFDEMNSSATPSNIEHNIMSSIHAESPYLKEARQNMKWSFLTFGITAALCIVLWLGMDLSQLLSSVQDKANIAASDIVLFSQVVFCFISLVFIYLQLELQFPFWFGKRERA